MKTIRDTLLLFLILLFCNAFGCKETDKKLVVSSDSQNYAPSELIVRFKPEAFDEGGSLVSESVRALNNKYGLVSIEPIFKGKPPGGLSDIYKLKFPPEVDIMELIQEYQKDPLVLYAEPNYIVHIME